MIRALSFVLAALGCAPSATQAAPPPPPSRAAASASSAEPPPAETQEDEGMYWPDGLRANVAVQVSGSRTQPGLQVHWNAKGSYVLSLDESTSTIKISQFSGWTGKLPTYFEDLPAFVQPFLSTIIIGPHGEFIRLEDPPAVRAAILQHMESTGLGRKEPRESLERKLGDVALEGFAFNAWSRIYQVWAYAPPVGESVASTNRAPVHHEGGAEIDVHVTTENRGDAPCPSAAARTCRTVVTTTQPDSKQVLDAMQSRRDLKGRGIRSYEERNEFELVAEVGTLVPFALSERKASRVGLKSGAESTTAQSTYTFTYEDL